MSPRRPALSAMVVVVLTLALAAPQPQPREGALPGWLVAFARIVSSWTAPAVAPQRPITTQCGSSINPDGSCGH